MEKCYTCRVALNNWKDNQTPGMVLLKLVVVTIFNLYIHKTDKKLLSQVDATYVECSFYKVQLSPKQSWSVVRSRRLKEGTLSWRRWRCVHASLRVVLIETEGIAAVEPLRRWYTTGGSIDHHWSNLERDTCIWMAHERKSVSDTIQLSLKV